MKRWAKALLVLWLASEIVPVLLALAWWLAR